MSLSMSDRAPDAEAKARAKLPVSALPWIAVLAMAALWPKSKKTSHGGMSEPRAMSPAQYETAEPGRGRSARFPWLVPALGWKDIFWRTYRETGRDRLPALAGGVTFYVLLAAFPALAAFVSLYGLFSDVASVERQLEQMSAVFPRDAVTLIGQQMMRVATQKQATLSAAFIAATAVSVWSANAGMKALFDGINIAYDETEKRDYLRRTLLTYAATLAALLFLVIAAAVMVAAPVYLKARGVVGVSLWWAPLRWAAVYLIAAAGFTLLYRYGPSRRHARWRWVAPGACAAALLWLIGSLGFSWYVNNFTHFGVTYGSLGAMIAFMLWVWFSVMVVLTGAELNAEIEHQTACDTTTGAEKPMGERGAVMADTVGKAFTVSPREAVQWGGAFLGRQVGYVGRFLRRLVPL
jgi:membrane protein